MRVPQPVIVHLTVVHGPVDIRIYHRECKALAEAGYRVILVAPAPEVPGDQPEAPVEYRALPRIENRFLRMLYSAFVMPWAILAMKADLYHFHDPELIPLGLFLKLFRRRVIWDVHEDVPGQITYKYYLSSTMKSLLKEGMILLEWLAAKSMDAAVCATPAIARKIARHGIPTYTVQNFPIMEELLDDGGRGEATEARKNIVYVGGITPVRGALEMVRAMGRVSPAFNDQLLLAGPYGPRDLFDQCAEEQGWEKVQYLGVLDRSQAIALLGRSVAGLVLFHPLRNHVDAQPNKIFEYMSAGLPVIASDFPLWREIVADNGCGINVDPMDPEAIACAVERLLRNPEEARAMGERGHRLVREKYNWPREVPRLLEAYQDTLRGMNV